jgi:hypothetical protein
MALEQQMDHRCPCGRELRHRGSCEFRRSYGTKKERSIDKNQTAEPAAG